MTLFGEIYFFFLAGALLIPAVIMGIAEKPLRYYGFLITVIFVALATVSEPEQLVYLIVYCMVQILLVKGFVRIRKTRGANKALFRIFILFSLAPLLTVKISGLAGESIFGFIGISYLTFKAIQVLIEIEDGLIEEVRVFDFLYFLLFFPLVHRL